ncbi:MAG: hypothetical protein ACTH7W_04190 [Psychrobacter sp.]|uniref:hypothetical protein n=1 Tax=unclassified Psychrobacter TaxID=196806 RepID=UPI003F99D80A
MNIDTQSVDQTVSAMAVVLAKYLDPEEVRLLTTQWQQYSRVSVKMMQQCILDATRRYPELKEHKSDIRKGFWDTMTADNLQGVTATDSGNDINKQKSINESTLAFYTVMEAIGSQLTKSHHHNFFHNLHQMVARERTFKGHIININQFLESERPIVPDATELLNHIVQLAYVCLCDMLGPVDADEILFRVADIAKQSHPKEVVERLF